MGRNMHGRDGADAVISGPPGTILRDAETGELIKDFGAGKDGETWLFLKGGNGGWGNTHFKSSTNQAPRHSSGQPAREAASGSSQLIADIGLSGCRMPASLPSRLFHQRAPLDRALSFPQSSQLGMLNVHDATS
jgi:GTPase involved in cell partitioning and DNA repair